MDSYSDKPLAEKLGISEQQPLAIINAPSGYMKKLDIAWQIDKSLKGKYDFIQFFAINRTALQSNIAQLKDALGRSGSLWLCWPKGLSKIDTDLKEGIVQKIGLDAGLVDIKVSAIDETWSGLKFVFRLSDR